MKNRKKWLAFLYVTAVVSCVAAKTDLCAAEDWPQWRGPNRDGVWNETGIVKRFATERLKPKWTAKVGSGYSGPTVAQGRVFVTDRLVEPKQIERVHAFDERTGKPVWSYAYDCPYLKVGYQAGPRASVTIDEGRAFALGTMGHLHVLDAATGKILWKADLSARYKIRMPIWGIAAAPLIYKDLVVLHIGGSDGACVVALDKANGKEKWRALDDRASYSAPVMIDQAGKKVLVVWTGDNVAGIEPATGRVLWKVGMKPSRMVIGIATPVLEDNRLFVTSFYDGSLMVKLGTDKPTAEQLWRKVGRDEKNTQGLHSIISTPLMMGGFVYGVDSYGELRSLEAATGKRIWEDRTATPRSRWSNIHIVRNGKDIWMFNERGELIIARLSSKGFSEISRTKLIEPTLDQLRRRGGVCWAHPAFANRHVFARNDKELVCASLEE